MSNINENQSVAKNVINWYPGHMAKTKRQLKEKIDLIDIIYEVVDARMPKSSKMRDMEPILKGKPRVLIMTKKDLCDLSITNKWINKYQKNGDTVVLMDLTNNKDYKELVDITKKIMDPINKKRREKGLKDKEIKIGVVGIPNVGKSTLINKLVGKKVAVVGNKPGVTKSINWLKTNYGFMLLDTPGILWPNLGDNDTALALASTATIRPEIINMTDIGGYLVAFYKNRYPNILNEYYKIGSHVSINEIFKDLACKFKMFDDEEPDYEKISQKLYNDLISGKIVGVTFDYFR